MKLISGLKILVFLSLFGTMNLQAQDCKKFHLYSTCMQFPGNFFKMDGQSRSNVMGVNDKLIYNVIFYGERQYKMYFCATAQFNPVSYTLIDSDTKELIYDSSKDKYPESLDISIEKTRKILIEISVLATNVEKEQKEQIDSFLGCVGFILYWKPDVKKK